MRVAMWSSWETRCGIASYTASLVEELRHHVEVDVVPVPYRDRDPARMSERLTRLNAADLVHIQHEHSFWGEALEFASTLPTYYSRLVRHRVITAHSTIKSGNLRGFCETDTWPTMRTLFRPGRVLENGSFRPVDAMILHTRAASRQIPVREICEGRVFVVPPGIPKPARKETSSEDEKALRDQWDLSGSLVLTIFGYITPNKGYEQVLEALPKLPSDVKLVIAGSSRTMEERPYREELAAWIRACGLEKRVVITGYLNESQVTTVMALSDLVLAPHTVATGSYSVMVALGHRRPVLASDLPCFREIREQRPCLELFPAGDKRALRERIRSLLASREKRERLAGSAQEFAEERSWAAAAHQTLKIYEAALRR